MHNGFIDYFSIFMALLRRDIKIFTKEFTTIAINSLILVCLNVLLFGYLLPALGINPHCIGPLFLGSCITIFMESGFSLATSMAIDLSQNKFIHYQLLLPLPKKWLFAEYVTMFVIQSSLVCMPAMLMGIYLLKDKLHIVHTNWILFFAVYLLAAIFFALLFLYLALSSSFSWFMNNIWPRVLSPLANFGCIIFSWKGIYSFSPKIALLFLCNPITYASEGMRATILGGPAYLDATLCIIALSGWIVALMLLTARTITKKLDFS